MRTPHGSPSPATPVASARIPRAPRVRLLVALTLSTSLSLLSLAACGGAGADRGVSITEPPAGAPSTPANPQTPAPPLDPRWDPASPLPALIEANYIDVSRVAAVSRFRSSIGHDYADDYEQCRSMKHYFRPEGTGSDWEGIHIVAPVTGQVTRVIQEWAGAQIQIRSRAYPAFTVILFHVAPDRAYAAGDSVVAGELLGTHVGGKTMSDVAVLAATDRGRAYVSYMQALPAALFAPFAERGATGRDGYVITRAERDASPLVCDGDAFVGTDTLSQWVTLGGQ